MTPETQRFLRARGYSADAIKSGQLEPCVNYSDSRVAEIIEKARLYDAVDPEIEAELYAELDRLAAPAKAEDASKGKESCSCTPDVGPPR